MTDPVTPGEQGRQVGVTPTAVTDAGTSHVTALPTVTATEGAELLHDLTHLPDAVSRPVTDDAAAFLRAIWQAFPKHLPDLITEPEEEPDER